MDGVDVAVLRTDGHATVEKMFAAEYAYDPVFKAKLEQGLEDAANLTREAPRNEKLIALEEEITQHHIAAVRQVLKTLNLTSDRIDLIGFHGQTVLHRPNDAFTVQLGDGQKLADETGISVVYDMRSNDMANGGQGAPLVPVFHQALARTIHERLPQNLKSLLPVAFVNIGGISNISVLCPDQQTVGFDTGPGNALMDAWSLRERGLAYDESGNWARSGKVIPELLSALLEDPYFKRSYPKSTGKEHFNLHWLDSKLNTSMDATDVQATLVELTAQTIVDSSTQACNAIDEVYICGGGAKNDYLMQRLSTLFSPVVVGTTDDLGVNADWVEAMAFAWLARQTLLGLPGNLPAVTGASGLRVLGAIYPAG